MEEKILDEQLRLTPEAIMQFTLNDFNIAVSLPMAEAIYSNFMAELTKHGYAEWVENT